MFRLVLALLLFIGISLGEDLSYSRYFLVDRIYLMPFVFKHQEYLGIDQKQMELIREFVREHERKVKEKVELLKHLERKAKEKIMEGRKDDKLEELLKDIAGIKVELSLLNLECVSFLKKVLREEQFNRLKTLIAIRLFELQR